MFKNELQELFKYSYKPKFYDTLNGNSFDHKFMIDKGIFKNINKDQLLDSRYIIRILINSDDINLKNLYDKLIENKTIKNYKIAEADVMMLYQILKKLNYKI